MNAEEKRTEVTEVVEEVKDVVTEEQGPEFIEKFKESEIGKTIFGDDGKFDMEDVERLSGEATEAIKGTIDKVKDLFR